MLVFRGVVLTVLFAITCTAVPQNDRPSLGRDVPMIWQPPTLDFPDISPEPTVPTMMIASIRLADMDITLEETTLDSVKTRFGGEMGHSGDASEALQWLCFYGMGPHGRWALWLESSEMGGGSVDGVAVQRLDNDSKIDRRCRALRKDGGFKLPIAIRLGMTELQVRTILGQPTLRYRNTLMFDHGHQQTIRNEPFTVSNTVAVTVRDGIVWAIQVWKGTSN